MIDATDRKILGLLQQNARMSNAELARQIGMAPSATFERIRKLEERGVVHGYEARIDPHALALGMTAFVFVRTSEPPGHNATARALAAIPDVQEVHNLAGEDCFLIKVRVRDPEDLARLLREEIGPVKSITSTRSTIVLETIKETSQLPLEERTVAEKRRRAIA